MRNLILALGAAATVLPALAAPAAAQYRDRGQYQYRDQDGRYYNEYRGRDGRRYCKRSDGTTGLVVGGVAGALLGRTIDRHGDRTVGTLGGAAVGALAGRAVERSGNDDRRCR